MDGQIDVREQLEKLGEETRATHKSLDAISDPHSNQLRINLLSIQASIVAISRRLSADWNPSADSRAFCEEVLLTLGPAHGWEGIWESCVSSTANGDWKSAALSSSKLESRLLMLAKLFRISSYNKPRALSLWNAMDHTKCYTDNDAE